MPHGEIDTVKADMTHIYNQPDPRHYFRELGKVDYKLPDRAKPVFSPLINYLENRKEAPVCALDLGCSYGINAALLKHDIDMDDLHKRWTDPQFDSATPEEIIDADRRFFNDLPVTNMATVIGLDSSALAISYGNKTGLLDAGMALDLEEEHLPDATAKALLPVDLVMSTGCIGYVTETSFAKLMPVITQGRQPWLANFVLRMYPFDPIAQELAKHGYVTEKLDNEQFVQRTFVSREEQEGVLERLAHQGLDPVGEDGGKLIAEFYLSRPKQDAEKPLRDLLGL
ncbi:hypothetical protein AB1K62_06890 [Parasphingorhabdus sp. JC815]|uniref:hypothetical protein n=1 Tax=Parasphingorhabdus sp. JC815 TaxID=3232140 RepID=UPI0034575099